MSESTNTLPKSQDSATREERRNWANCFHNDDKVESSHADYTGVLVLEETGGKYWVNLYGKKDKNGKTYVAVNLRPWKARANG
jgi:hypothetical protein